MTARRCKAGDLSAEPLALPDPVVASGLDGKMCSTPAGIPWVLLFRFFSGTHRRAAMQCAALPLRSTQGTWTQGSNVWQAKGPKVRFSPGLAKEERQMPASCARPQYWRRSLRKLPEGLAAGGKLKSGQVEARETTMAAQSSLVFSADGYDDKGQLSNGLAASQAKQDRHRHTSTEYRHEHRHRHRVGG
ncbi:hypothetical protein KVR01_000605 [Diaporthe batatas]|uniref:uncharacterized protein n=1 Tax=Diaporthe batatas TaxID=748121 RepID=UPI001D048151|nr:uncharacterized protein KVR01_000605 [Diaporthe batatas]KAG8169860.1 hypothetical protein KVR01_000605 [Diaporthe batatas]